MGVPKFYRWISERYPCLSQVIKDYQIPEFDNFYLDMNGIIHVCSHPNDDDPTFRISEDKIFNDIFNYVEALFRIIKPRKVMFLAVDGVAPRAKMNQQRGRRFRSAREAQDLIRKALQSGRVMPSEPRFDSNCITPGTEFMCHLQKHLKYFVHRKLATDPSWHGVEVILSGQDVPGEGEHKIMEYIRYRKAQPDYDPNTRHCLYGLDADLIMLGLLSHEPHFSLLREEIRFGRKSQKRTTSPSTVTFHLLHLSILREYLDFEFEDLKGKLPFGYDLEKVIDDWVLMGFLVGNDFLPHLPNMHIRQSSLPLLYRKYREVLPTLDGYINDGGHLNMRRFEAYLKAVAKHDYDSYGELRGDQQWLEGRKRQGKEKKKAKRKADKGTHRGIGFDAEDEVSFLQSKDSFREQAGDSFLGLGGDSFIFSSGGDDTTTEEDSQAVEKLQRDLGIRDLESFFDEEDEDREESFGGEFSKYKAIYYQEKLGFVHVDKNVLAEQAKCYVVGIQWVLHYYYTGVPSWSWFYPYHYAPFVSDVHGFADLRIDFELGNPFHPFEQLLAVLPPASKALLPRAYQGLMVNEDSPIKRFYPEDFQTDLNGKEHDWEAVVLIPFIDEDQLMEAMQGHASSLLKEEVLRNGPGPCFVCSHDDTAPGKVYPSPWQQHFPDIQNCKVKVQELLPPVYQVEKHALVRGLCEGVKLDVYFPGFPTLKHIPHSAQLEKCGVRVFQAASRDDNVILTVARDDQEALADMMKLAKQLLGKPAFVGWPHLVEAKIHSLTDGQNYYQLGEVVDKRAKLVTVQLNGMQIRTYNDEVSTAVRQYRDTKGIHLGDVQVILYAQVLQGRRYMVDKKGDRSRVNLHKEWAVHPEPFPYQTMVRDITAFAPNYKNKPMSVTELFPVGAQCFLMAALQYGCQAEVLSVISAQSKVEVRVSMKQEPRLSHIPGNYRLSLRYMSSSMVAGKMRISPLLLSRITGSIQVEMGSPVNVKERNRANIGLFWKFSRKNLEIPGYARKMETGGWSYSPEAIKKLEEFMEKFPVMFNFLVNNPSEDRYYESQLFPSSDGPENLSAVKEWMKQLPSQSIDTVDCGSSLLDRPQVAAIEKAVRDTPAKEKNIRMRVKPSALFKSTPHQGNLLPDPRATYQLYDRVLNVSMSNAVPFGLRGTIIGILGDQSESCNYEILFDEEFLGALTLRSSPNRAYPLPASCLLNLSYGKRLFDSEMAQKNVAASHNHRPDQSYASAATVFRGQESHIDNYADNYLRNPRRDSGQQMGHGLVANKVNAKTEHTDSPRGRGMSPGRGRGVSPRRGHGVASSGPSPQLQQDRDQGSRPGLKEQLSSLASTMKEIDSSTQSHPASAIKLKSSPSKLTQADVGVQAGSVNLFAKTPPDARKGKKAGASESSRKSRQNNESRNKTGEVIKQPGEGDHFSAALDALSKLDFSDMPSPTSKSSPAVVKIASKSAEQGGRHRVKENKDGSGGPRKRDKVSKTAEEKSPQLKSRSGGTAAVGKTHDKVGNRDDRELSPSVAAMFEALKGSNQDGLSGAVQVAPGQPGSPRDAGTATLKTLLNMDSPSSAQKPYTKGRGKTPTPSPSKAAILSTPQTSSQRHGGSAPISPQNSPFYENVGGAAYVSQPSQYHPTDLPDTVRKLLRPPQKMAARGRGSISPQQPPLIRGFPPPQIPQNNWTGFGYPSPPIIPFPPSTDNIKHLMLTAQSLGFPPPQISTKKTEKGYLGLVVLGSLQYGGAPCSSEDEAAQSAAAMANINLKPVHGPPHPLLYYPPRPVSSFPPTNAGVGYSPASAHTPPRSAVYNPFVPLQAQRRTPKSTPVKGTSSETSSPPKAAVNTAGSGPRMEVLPSTTVPTSASTVSAEGEIAKPTEIKASTKSVSQDDVLELGVSGASLALVDHEPAANKVVESPSYEDTETQPAGVGLTAVNSEDDNPLGVTPTRRANRQALEQAFVNLSIVKAVPRLRVPASGEFSSKESAASTSGDEPILEERELEEKVGRGDVGEQPSGMEEGGAMEREHLETEAKLAEASQQEPSKLAIANEHENCDLKRSVDQVSQPVKNAAGPHVTEGLETGASPGDAVGPAGEEETNLVGEEEMLERIQNVNKKTNDDIKRLVQYINVVKTPIVLPSDETIVQAVDESTPKGVEASQGIVEAVGDAVIQAALAVSQEKDDDSLLEEVYQPCNSAQVDDTEVVVVGEIVGGTSFGGVAGPTELMETSVDRSVEEVVPTAPVDTTAGSLHGSLQQGVVREETTPEPVTGQADCVPSIVPQTSHKRHKFQLAASFNQ